MNALARLLATPLVALLVVVAAPAWADVGRDEAAATAQRVVRGRVLSVDKTEADRRPAWRVKVLPAQGEVRVIVTPDQVDDVLITHLHPDHIGGLMLEGALAFPKATLHLNKRDAAYWLDKETMAKAPESSKGFFEGAMVSVNPWIAAGRCQMFETDGELVPGVMARTTFGHTAGHTSYVVEDGGQTMFIIGDLLHVPAVQLENPSVTIAYDTDEKAAILSREKLFTQPAKQGALVGAAHFPFPGVGHLRASGKGWQWVPLNYSTRLR